MSPPLEFVAFDLETTGLSPKADQVLEVGAVRFDAEMRRVATMEVLVDPGIPIPLAIQRLCGLTDRDVRGSPAPVEAVAQLADFCEGAHLVAHGATFDMTFCGALAPQAFGRRAVFDTLDFARILLPTAASHSLPQLSAALGLCHDRPHRALSDAIATHELFGRLRAAAEDLPDTVLAQARAVAGLEPGSLPRFFIEVVRGRGSARAVWTGSSTPPAAATESVVATPLTSPPDIGAAAAALLQEAAVGDAESGAFEVRETQVQMARAVGQALQRRRRLLVEAGTGVGKSLGYLVPLALYSREGRRSVVATRTLTLQEQLLGADVPRVERLLGSPVAAVVLKGRNHQLSLRRWERFRRRMTAGAAPADPEGVRFTLKLLAWTAQTTTGDRDELHLTSAEEALWRHVESDGGDCLATACSNWQEGRCFMVAARRAAERASIVITNHGLLLADSAAGGFALGPHDALVIDEAHHLEEAATDQLGARLRAADVLVVLDRLPAAPGALEPSLRASRDAAIRLFGDVKGRIGEVLGADHPGNATVALDGDRRSGHGHEVLMRSGEHAVAAWRSTAALLRESDEAPLLLDLESLPQPEQADEERLLAATALEALAATAERVLLRPREGFVCWLALRAEHGELHEAPVSVAEHMRDSVLSGPDAVVATSATLAVAGDFRFTAERLGLSGAEELVLGSPFDFLEQALCVLPRDVPPYDDPGHDAAVAAMIGDAAERLGGSTLALFTGYAPLRRVHALLAARLEREGIALLGQGLDGTRRQILASFLANRRTVLLGTTSFWEGVDVPGDALRCVVIAKLPFAVPTDPLVRARTSGLADPFGQYVLPMAVLRLRQGFGRLIRRGDDRGAVVLCDERLDSREYGERFLAALPPSAIARVPVTEVGETVADFVLHRRLPDMARTSVAAGQSAQRHFPDEEPA